MDINDNDLLTWEIQLRREGTLPPEVQGRLLGQCRHLLDQVDELESTIFQEAL
jgi:hypothetical protein